MEQTRTRLDRAAIAYVIAQGGFFFFIKHSQFNSNLHLGMIFSWRTSNRVLNLSLVVRTLSYTLNTKELQALVSGDYWCWGTDAVTMVSWHSSGGGFSTIKWSFKWRYCRAQIPMDENELINFLSLYISCLNDLIHSHKPFIEFWNIEYMYWYCIMYICIIYLFVHLICDLTQCTVNSPIHGSSDFVTI